jgi:hypothetical protein
MEPERRQTSPDEPTLRANPDRFVSALQCACLLAARLSHVFSFHSARRFDHRSLSVCLNWLGWPGYAAESENVIVAGENSKVRSCCEMDENRQDKPSCARAVTRTQMTA